MLAISRTVTGARFLSSRVAAATWASRKPLLAGWLVTPSAGCTMYPSEPVPNAGIESPPSVTVPVTFIACSS